MMNHIATTANVRSARWAVIAVLALAAFPASAIAGDDFKVSALAIRATSSNTEVSSELKDMAERLKKELRCTGLKLDKRATGTISKNGTASLSLAHTYRVAVTPLERKDGRVTMQVEIFRKAAKKPDDKGGKKDRKDRKDKGDDGEERVQNVKLTLDAGKYQVWGFAYPGGGDDKLAIAVCCE